MIKGDMMYYPEQYIIVYKLSFLSLFTSFYGIYRQKYELFIVPGMVFLTSINHWKKPMHNSVRRKVDLICVNSRLVYKLIIGYNSEFYVYYYFFLIFASALYPIGKYFYSKNLYWHSICIHGMLHILANIACIILYSGNVIPINHNPVFLYLTAFLSMNFTYSTILENLKIHN